MSNRWTEAAVARFASSLVRRRLNEIAPPAQLNRSASLIDHAMSESLTDVVFGLMVTITMVITIWAPLTLATAQKSTTDQALYAFFSVFLAAQLGVTFLLRRSFHGSYVSAALFALLVLLSLAGSLFLLLLGVTLSFARWHQRPVGTVIAACLSGAVFVVLCVTLLR